MEFEGLENKLDNVHVGDFLHLETKKGDKIGGYVINLTTRTIKLSHESPNNEFDYGIVCLLPITIGDRKYVLRKFSKYQVINLNDSSSE